MSDTPRCDERFKLFEMHSEGGQGDAARNLARELERENAKLRDVVNSEVQSLRAVQSYVTAHGPQAVAVNLGTILDNLARAARPWTHETEHRDVRVLAVVGIWAMVRRPGCAPYVCETKHLKFQP